MTEAATVETTAEPVPPVPEAVVEVETAAPEQADATAPAENRDQRSLAFDVEHLGVLRRAVLDALLDADEPLSVSRILAEMPVGTSRGNAESAIKREFDQGRIMRTSPGHYALAPARAEPPKPAPSPDPPAVRGNEEWLAAMDEWFADRSSWDVQRLGPQPNEPDNRIPPDVRLRFNDRMRKRAARRKEAEAAQARQSAADQELRTKLLAAANGNFQPGPALDDMTCIREVLNTVPIDQVIMTIKQTVDKRCFPGNPPLVSWSDPAFLQALAEAFCRSYAVPGLVREWGNAGKAPTTRASSPPDLSPIGEKSPALMPDDIVDRSHHDQENAPPGPHVMPQPDAAPDVPANAADVSEAPPAVLTRQQRREH